MPLHLTPLNHLLAGHLLLVERREVVDDDRNRKRDDEDAADAARGAHQLSPPRPRELVAVADCRHRDRRPPERTRNAHEVRSRLVLLGEVDEAGEDEDLDGEEHHQQAELLVAALQREAERLQPGGMARQLEHSQDSKDAQKLDEAGEVVEMIGGVGLVDAEWHVVGQDGDQVDHVESAPDELAAVRRGPQPHRVLEREPADAGRL